MSHGALDGKLAIVTGAGSPIGLGRAMVLALVQAGARVAMLEVDTDALRQSATDARQLGGPRLCSTDRGRRVAAGRYRAGRGSSKAAHEAFTTSIAQALKGTGVPANVLVPGGTANTNLLSADSNRDRSKILSAEVMQAPVVWLASEASHGFTEASGSSRSVGLNACRSRSA
jgi:NAD(P)-dependent dehydrogenase (short-subunit alcohol dehydrogenase family)